MTIHVINITWEPQDQDISNEEFEAMLDEAPSELDIEVDSLEEFEDDSASFLDTDELKAKHFQYNIDD